MAKSYEQKLLDPKWQKKRLLILSRDNFTCQYCGDTETTLHVHHKRYSKDNPWDIENEYLTTLCADCHCAEEFRKMEYKEHFTRKIIKKDWDGFVYITMFLENLYGDKTFTIDRIRDKNIEFVISLSSGYVSMLNDHIHNA